MIFHASELLLRIERLEKNLSNSKISLKEIKSIRKLMLKKHTPPTIDILQAYNISPLELLTGVHCPNCSRIPIQYLRKKWHCIDFHTSFVDAHIQALDDYFLVIKSTITNSECRTYLHLPTSNVAKKLLTSMDLHQVGQKKGRYYQLQKTTPK